MDTTDSPKLVLVSNLDFLLKKTWDFWIKGWLLVCGKKLHVDSVISFVQKEGRA